MKKKYINKAQTTFKSAVKTSSESKVDWWTSYANFLIDTRQFLQAYDYLIRSIDSGDYESSLKYFRKDRTIIPPTLRAQLQQKKVVKVRAIDYAFYLLLHHYDTFLSAGITPAKSRAAYLTTYQQVIKVKADQLIEAKLLLNSL